MTDLVLISSDSEESLVREMKRLVAFIDRVPDAPLDDIAYTCSLSKGDSVVAIIAPSTSALRAKLASAVGRIPWGASDRSPAGSGTGAAYITSASGSSGLAAENSRSSIRAS